jgi:site-specific recombinase XerD
LHWDAEKSRSKNDKGLNEELAFIENKIYQIKRDLQFQGKIISASIIKRLFLGKEESESKACPSLVDFYRKYITKCAENKQEYSKGVLSKHKNTLNKLSEFLKTQSQEGLLIEEVQYSWIKSFDHFLMTRVTSKSEKPMCRNTTNKHHRRLKTIFLLAHREGVISQNPYRDFILRNTATNREFLSEQEIERLKSHSLGGNTSLIRVRDIFMFSIYSGLRFSDAMSLTSNDLLVDHEQRTWINKTQTKTNERVMVPLLSQAMEILSKYRPNEVTKIILPSISNQKLNSYLKTIAELVGINKKLTHHIARHTFATTITLSNDIPVEVVSKWLGHNSIRTTQIYAKVTSQYSAKVISRLEQKLSK